MLDICVQNGWVDDGGGRGAARADVGVRNGKIAAVGNLADAPSRRVIDAGGRLVCPGFLDLHRHADAAIVRSDYGDGDLFQGITTVGNGNCGLSIAPQAGGDPAAIASYLRPVTGDTGGIPTASLSDYFAALSAHPLPVHALMLAGGGTIRAAVAGFTKTSLDDGDFAAIHALLEKTLAEGAAGVSLGLGYAPECFYTTDELIRALQPIAHSDTVLSVHLRGEAMHLLPSIDEMVTVARALRVPLQISHLKATGKRNWRHTAQDALERLARAREDGVDVLCDVYAYTAGSTQLMHILPPEYLQGGPKAIAARLGDPAQRKTLLDRLENGRDFDNYAYLVGWENILVSSVRLPEDARYVGQSMAEACGDGDPASFALDLLMRNECEVTMIDRITCEDDIAAILQSPLSYVISDATFPTGGRLHPRLCGAFTNVLETYVNRRKSLSLTEAIRKMTRLPADRYHLSQKGRIAVGADADILVFDPAAVRVNATYADPTRPASGMETVLVNGVPAIENGVRTGACAGTVIKGIR